MKRELVMHDFNVDFASLAASGHLKGYSGRITVKIETDYIDKDEQVIIDFGTVKKFIKGFLEFHHNNNIFFERNSFEYENINEPEKYGIDHKLLCANDVQSFTLNAETIINTPLFTIHPVIGGVLKVKNWESINSRNSDEYEYTNFDFSLLNMEDMFKSFCQNLYDIENDNVLSLDQLSILLKSKVSFKFVTEEKPLIFEDLTNEKYQTSVYFDYVHGLPDSTSYGCQNTFHGHRCVISVYSDKQDFNKDLLSKIFYDHDEFSLTQVFLPVHLTHKTNKRGQFDMRLNVEENYGDEEMWFIKLPFETTIENLGVYYKNLILELYNEAGFDELKFNDFKIYISEGMQKGVLI